MSVPSWMRWPPNCCETCINWRKNEKEEWVGKCTKSDFEEVTDARFRCQDFVRREGA